MSARIRAWVVGHLPHLSMGVVFFWVLFGFAETVVNMPTSPADPLDRVLLWAGNGALLVLLLGARVLRERMPKPVQGLCFLVVIGGGLALLAWSPDSPAIVLSYIALGFAAALVGIGWGLGLTVVAVGGTLAVDVFVRHHVSSNDLLAMLAYLGVLVVALGSRSRDRLKESESRNEVLDERSRIAREIHDILAHSLSAQVVHLEGAKLLLTRDGDGDRDLVLERIERAQRLAKSGLEETRRALATLRGDAPPPEEALAALAEEFRATAGRPCDLELLGPSRELPASAGLAVVRTAQEGLTNVRRHAPGARAVVRLRYLPSVVTLEITDTGGRAAEGPLEGSGYGLVGMRERAELIGGTLEAGSVEGGFRVFLEVPA